MTFERHIPKRLGRSSPISELEIGEMLFFPEKNHRVLYNRMYAHTRRHGKEFSYEVIKNGTIVRRDK